MEKEKFREELEKIIRKEGLEGKLVWAPETILDDLYSLLPIKSLGKEPARMITKILPCERIKDEKILDKLSLQDIEGIKEKFRVAKSVRKVIEDIDKAGLLEIKNSDPRIQRMGYAFIDFETIGVLALLESGEDIFDYEHLVVPITMIVRKYGKDNSNS